MCVFQICLFVFFLVKNKKKHKNKNVCFVFFLLKLGSTRMKAGEVLFDPSLIGLEYRGVHECILTAIQRADLDLRRELYQNILLAGGTTYIKGFGARLMGELQSKLGKTKVKIFAPVDRTLTAWIGGSMLSCMSAFQPLWIKKKEWEETGDAILDRKSFA